jgi:aspartyl protease family protein
MKQKLNPGFKKSNIKQKLALICLFSISMQSNADPMSPSHGNQYKNQAENSLAGNENPGSIRLISDRSGHFRGTIMVNNVSMPFLIDTGATFTSIPMKLATAAHLPFGQQIETSTANGRSFDKLTHIDRFIFGSVEIKNLEGLVNQHLSEVLLGMNVLKYFRINQSENIMDLILNEKVLKAGNNENGLSISLISQKLPKSDPQYNDNSPSRPINKSVSCDSQNHCITNYNNE